MSCLPSSPIQALWHLVSKLLTPSILELTSFYRLHDSHNPVAVVEVEVVDEAEEPQEAEEEAEEGAEEEEEDFLLVDVEEAEGVVAFLAVGVEAEVFHQVAVVVVAELCREDVVDVAAAGVGSKREDY